MTSSDNKKHQTPNTPIDKSNTEDLLMRCPKCDAQGSIKKISIGCIFNCKNCGNVEFFNDDIPANVKSSLEASEINQEWDNRTLCFDENCTGTISQDGYCNECGKNYSEARNANTIENKIESHIHNEKLTKSLKTGKIFLIYVIITTLIISVFIGILSSTNSNNTDFQKFFFLALVPFSCAYLYIGSKWPTFVIAVPLIGATYGFIQSILRIKFFVFSLYAILFILLGIASIGALIVIIFSKNYKIFTRFQRSIEHPVFKKVLKVIGIIFLFMISYFFNNDITRIITS